MGNCQAVDAATLVIQHPCGRVDKFYWPVTATEIMKANPGHYVALLITTTLYHPTTTMTTSIADNTKNDNTKPRNSNSSSNSVRVTRVKLLRPTDTLTLGHAYRLISTQEVMKGMVSRKQAKTRKNGLELEGNEAVEKDAERIGRRSHTDRTNQVARQERHRSRTTTATNAGTAKTKTWQPSLHSISEAGS